MERVQERPTPTGWAASSGPMEAVEVRYSDGVLGMLLTMNGRPFTSKPATVWQVLGCNVQEFVDVLNQYLAYIRHGQEQEVILAPMKKRKRQSAMALVRQLEERIEQLEHKA